MRDGLRNNFSPPPCSGRWDNSPRSPIVFAGYEYWASLIESRIHFIIRVGSGVHLLKELGEWQQNDDRIWLWPAHVARNSLPPLKLRLVKVQGKQGSVWLVTSVLSHQRLSDAAIGEIYRQRWKLEVFFRDFKRTFGKHKQLSRTPGQMDQALPARPGYAFGNWPHLNDEGSTCRA